MVRLRDVLILVLVCLPSVSGNAQAPAPAPDSTFHITPQRPVADLEKEALSAQPPHESGDFRAPELVEVIKVDPTIHLDIRYATKNNFLSTPMYSQARAFLQRPAAEAVARAQRSLRDKGYGLLIHDAYRPGTSPRCSGMPHLTIRRSLSPIPKKAPSTIAAALWI